MVNPFSWTSGRMIYGPGSRWQLGERLREQKILLVTGRRWFKESGEMTIFTQKLESEKICWEHWSFPHEPSPQEVDEAFDNLKGFDPQGIVAIGGGSVLDGGKALAARFCLTHSIERYLEGVGDLPPTGDTLPLYSLPTTAGTGSEVTKNAVLSKREGAKGYKKSLRHDNYLPHLALLDPELTLHCPHLVTLYSSMDSLTQLLEGFLSTGGNLFSRMTALEGISLWLQAFPALLENPQGEHTLEQRGKLALAAYLSGLTLANGGLGTVHGMAGTLGGLSTVSHGEICSRLIYPVFSWMVENAETMALKEDLNLLGELFHRHYPEIRQPDALGFLQGLESLNQALPASASMDEEILRKAAETSTDKNNPIKSDKKIRLEILKGIWS